MYKILKISFYLQVCLTTQAFSMDYKILNYSLSQQINKIHFFNDIQEQKEALITIKLLLDKKYINVKTNYLKGYQTIIASNFNYKNSKELNAILISNKDAVQNIIEKVNTALETPLASKSLFQNDFPKAFNFRKPEHINEETIFSDWESNYSKLDGIFGKVLNEELNELKTKNSPNFFNRFAIDNPSKLVVLHFNGRSRSPKWEINNYSAGHWIYTTGCDLTKDINENDTEIYVSDSNIFKTNYGIRGAKKNDDIVLVPLDNNGQKIWEDAEQITLVSKENGKITVLRGQYGTKARTFIAGKTYIAPHFVEGPWGNIKINNLMWAYNLSTTCPKDKNGKQCADILADEIASWFKLDGPLFAFNGIQFDVSPWNMKNALLKKVADIDNDGKVDSGYINNINVYGQGVLQFYTRLKQKLGPNKLIIADGALEDSQRAVGVINGMEAEGFCTWNDVYKEFSKPLSFFNYWNKYGVKDQFSYVTHKDKMEGSDKEKLDRERMVAATAQCLGVGINSVTDNTIKDKNNKFSFIDELTKGSEKITHWLGKPLGAMINIAETKSPVIQSLKQYKIESQDYSSKLTDTGINFTALKQDLKSSSVSIKNVALPKGDIIICFDAITNSPLPGFNESIPRQISVSLKGRNPEENTADEILNYVNSKDMLPCSFYFRNAGGTNADIVITLEGNTNFSLKNFRIYNSPQVLAREFENGVVLVNPSLNDYTFNLNELFPKQHFKRISATKNQKNELNTGEKVGENVLLSKLNGLFLIKDK